MNSDKWRDCPECGGDGVILIPYDQMDPGDIWVEAKCDNCDGNGFIRRYGSPY